MFGMSRRPQIEHERVPRTRREVKKKSFLMRHLWYCSWGTVGIAGIAAIYERSPALARKILPFYITIWVAGAVGLPPYLAKKGEQSKDAAIRSLLPREKRDEGEEE